MIKIKRLLVLVLLLTIATISQAQNWTGNTINRVTEVRYSSITVPVPVLSDSTSGWMFNRADSTLYRWTKSNPVWTKYVPNLPQYGPIGIGTAAVSTNYLKIGAGSTTISPLVLTSGAKTTAVVNGSVEYDGSYYYISFGGVRDTVATRNWIDTSTVTIPVSNGLQAGSGGVVAELGGSLTKNTSINQGLFSLELLGAQLRPIVVTAAGTYTILASDYTVVGSGTTSTWTFPTASSGRILHLVNHGSGAVTLGTAITTGNGATTTTLAAAAEVAIQYDGTVWRVISN